MNLEQIAQDVQQLTQGETVAIALAESISHKLRFVQVCQEREKKWSNS